MCNTNLTNLEQNGEKRHVRLLSYRRVFGKVELSKLTQISV